MTFKEPRKTIRRQQEKHTEFRALMSGLFSPIKLQVILPPPEVQCDKRLNCFRSFFLPLEFLSFKLSRLALSHETLLAIHLIPKWRPTTYSFVCMFISPFCLIFTSKFFCFFFFYILTRQKRLINLQTKEKFIGRHFGIRCTYILSSKMWLASCSSATVKQTLEHGKSLEIKWQIFIRDHT